MLVNNLMMLLAVLVALVLALVCVRLQQRLARQHKTTARLAIEIAAAHGSSEQACSDDFDELVTPREFGRPAPAPLPSELAAVWRGAPTPLPRPQLVPKPEPAAPPQGFAGDFDQASLRQRLQRCEGAGGGSSAVPEKYRLVAAMAERGLKADDIAAVLQLPEAEVTALMRLSQLSRGAA